jgi:hypothetical protein
MSNALCTGSISQPSGVLQADPRPSLSVPWEAAGSMSIRARANKVHTSEQRSPTASNG